MVDDPARHERHEIAEHEVDLVGLRRDGRLPGLGSPYDFVGRLGGAIGTDDSRSPIHRNVADQRPNSRSVGSGRFRLRATSPLAERAAPLTHRRITAFF
jgi:hypothetical protein